MKRSELRKLATYLSRSEKQTFEFIVQAGIKVYQALEREHIIGGGPSDTAELVAEAGAEYVARLFREEKAKRRAERVINA